MKKLLALVLALVMTLGLATVGANAADFKDESSIEYEEAVNVMNGIGVIQGDDNGNFNPKGTLTREQAAKIVAYMLLGKSGADSLSASAAPYSDVAADRWSAGAISYCATEGIIAGLGDGTFNPTGKLTGHQFAKMLLVALGYNPTYENLVNDKDWAINTAKLAVSAGLEEDLSIVMSQDITRDQAAKMAFNTLTADMVAYENPINVKTSDGTEVIVKADRYKADDVRGAKNVYDGRAENDEDVDKFCEVYFPDLKLVDSATNDFNEPVNQWSFKNTVISEEAQSADKVLVGSVTYQDLFNAAGTAAMNSVEDIEIYVDGTLIGIASKDDGNFKKGAKGSAIKAIDSDGNDDGWTKDNDEDLTWAPFGAAKKVTNGLAAPTGNGTITSVFVTRVANKNADDTFTININVKHVYVGKVTGVTEASGSDARKVTITAKTMPSSTITTFDLDTDYETNEFKKDDVVLYTASATNGKDAKIQSMELATLVSGAEVSKTSVEGNPVKPNKSVVTAGGKDYKLNINVKAESKTGKDAIDEFSTGVGDKYDLYLDNNGFIVWAEKTEETLNLNNYLVLVKAGKASGTATNLVADAVTLEGNKITNKTFTKYDGKDLTSWSQVSLYTVYKYTVNNGDYELKPVSGSYGSAAKANVNYASGAATLNGATATSSSVMIVYNMTDASVNNYNGIKNFPDITTGKGDKLLTDSDGLTKTDNEGKPSYEIIGAKNATVDGTDLQTTATNVVATLSKSGNVLAAVVAHNSKADGTADVKTNVSASDIIYVTSKNYTTSKVSDEEVYTFDVIKDGKVTTISTKSSTLRELLASDQDLFEIRTYDGEYADDIVPRRDTFTASDKKTTYENWSKGSMLLANVMDNTATGVSKNGDETTWGRVRINKDGTKADLKIGVDKVDKITVYSVSVDVVSGTFKLEGNDATNTNSALYIALATNSNTKFFEIASNGKVTEKSASDFTYDNLTEGEFSVVYDTGDNVATYIFYQKV